MELVSSWVGLLGFGIQIGVMVFYAGKIVAKMEEMNKDMMQTHIRIDKIFGVLFGSNGRSGLSHKLAIHDERIRALEKKI